MSPSRSMKKLVQTSSDAWTMAVLGMRSSRVSPSLGKMAGSQWDMLAGSRRRSL